MEMTKSIGVAPQRLQRLAPTSETVSPFVRHIMMKFTRGASTNYGNGNQKFQHKTVNETKERNAFWE